MYIDTTMKGISPTKVINKVTRILNSSAMNEEMKALDTKKIGIVKTLEDKMRAVKN